jgi:hypothetical protein
MDKIRLRHGDHEIELEGSKEFIEKHLVAFYGRLGSVPMASATQLKKEILETSLKKPSGKAPTPAEYYKSKGKTDGVSQVLIFGKYLEEYRNMSEFSQRDINTVANEAKFSKDIHGQYFTNAVKQGLLRSHGKGRYSLTLSAESALSAM